MRQSTATEVWNPVIQYSTVLKMTGQCNSHLSLLHYTYSSSSAGVVPGVRFSWMIKFSFVLLQELSLWLQKNYKFLSCMYIHICIYKIPSVLWRCWLGGRKGIRPVKNWVVGCWRGCVFGARCRLAYSPADATATHCLLTASVKSRLVLPFWYRLTRVVPEKGPLNVCVCVFLVCILPMRASIARLLWTSAAGYNYTVSQ